MTMTTRTIRSRRWNLRSKNIGKMLLTVAGCSVALTVGANTIYVSAEYGDDGNDGSQTSPVKTIQAGVNKLSGSSSHLWISNGVYQLDEPITFQDETAHNNCIVSSISGNPADVVIDGQNNVRCIRCLGYSTQFHGVTVENGYSEDGYASGFYLPRDFFVVSNCVVRNCRAVSSSKDVSGGGLYSKGITSIEDTLFVGCTAKATVDNKYARGGGFMKGAASNDSSEKTATIRNVVVSNCTVRAKSQSRPCGGGVYINRANVDGLAVLNCKVESCDALPATAAGHGGGIYKLTYITNTFENVFVTNCMSGYIGAGLFGIGYDEVGLLRMDNCSFMGNTVQPIPSSSVGAGGGVYLSKFNAATSAFYEISNCRFSGNRVISTSTDATCAGAGLYVNASVSSLFNCVIENNSVISTDGSSGAGYGGGVTFKDSPETVTVSNCVIAANFARRCGGFMLAGCNGGLLTDVFCISNRASNHYSIGRVNSTGIKNPVVIRNSYFTGNGGEAGSNYSPFLSDTTGSNAPVILEYCTFVSNCVDSAESYVVVPYTDSPGSATPSASISNLFVKGCVFSENCGKFAFPKSMNTVTNITCTYADNFRADWWTSVVELKNYDKSMMPGGTVPFVDLASDHRLKKDTPFIDKGIVEDWMGRGGKTGPLDMGDGTYTIVASGKYGVSVQRNGAVPRISGDAPDYGCFEFKKLFGFVLNFK